MSAVDVVVVGAGPAGAAAAITLRRAGRSVVVLDKASFPHDKICGDGLTTGALRRFDELGLDPTKVPSWHPVEDVVIRSPSGVERRFSLPRDNGLYAADRDTADLDAALVDVARKEGATIHESAPLEAIQIDDEGVTVTAGSVGELRSRYVVAADGMWSPTRKLLGATVEGYKGEWHTFRQYFDGVTGPAAHDLFVSFEPDFLPGYFWSFPLPDGRANVGFGIQRGGKHTTRDMKTLWPDILDRPFVRDLLGPDAAPIEPHRAWPIPCRPGGLPLSSGPVLYVGDAAAACDVMSGEGIGQALQTGTMAAEHINSSWHDPVAVARGYAAEFEHELGPDHRMSSLLIRALQHRKGARIAMSIAGFNDWTSRNFVRWLFEDSPRGIAYRPQIWRRGVLSGDGAYR